MPHKKLNAWAAFLKKNGGQGASMDDLLKAYKTDSPVKKSSPKKSSRKSRKPAAKKSVAKSPVKKAASKKSSRRKLNAWARYLKKHKGEGTMAQLLKGYNAEKKSKSPVKKSSRKSRKPAAKKSVAKSPVKKAASKKSVAKSPVKKAASKKSSRRKLNAWAKFLKQNGGKGKSMDDLLKAYKAGKK